LFGLLCELLFLCKVAYKGTTVKIQSQFYAVKDAQSILTGFVWWKLVFYSKGVVVPIILWHLCTF
jgi:hypothetical protein